MFNYNILLENNFEFFLEINISNKQNYLPIEKNNLQFEMSGNI